MGFFDGTGQEQAKNNLTHTWFQTCSKAEEWDNKRFSTQEVSGLSSQH